MSHLIFVYGTLKEGFSNFAVNSGVRVPGEFVTVLRYPLYVLGPFFLPWLVEAPGEGQNVVGELFEVDAAGLVRMDALEQVDDPGWYERRPVRVHRRAKPAADATEALAYFGSRSALQSQVVHAGPIAEYTRVQDRRYRGDGP